MAFDKVVRISSRQEYLPSRPAETPGVFFLGVDQAVVIERGGERRLDEAGVQRLDTSRPVLAEGHFNPAVDRAAPSNPLP